MNGEKSSPSKDALRHALWKINEVKSGQQSRELSLPPCIRLAEDIP